MTGTVIIVAIAAVFTVFLWLLQRLADYDNGYRPSVLAVLHEYSAVAEAEAILLEEGR